MTTKTQRINNEGVTGWGANSRSLRRPSARTGSWRALWIQQLYQIFLGRQASQAEVRLHEGQLAAGLDPKRLPRALATSREGRERTIHRLYRRYLGRSADAVGLRYYRKALGRGRTRVEIERDLLVSAEYASIQGPTPQGWLHGLYEDVHGRAADPSGFDYFEQDLAGSPQASIAMIFLTSQARRERWVRACYVEILERAPSWQELAAWVRRLGRGTSLDEVRYALAAALAAPSAWTTPSLSLADDQPRALPSLQGSRLSRLAESA